MTPTLWERSFLPSTPPHRVAGGKMLNLLIGLLLLPATRALGHVGVPSERALKYHRMLGWAVLIFSLAHVVLEHSDWIAQGMYARNLFSYIATNRGQVIWPWAVPMMELVFSGVVFAAIAACDPIRRRFYWIFLALHIVVMPTFVVATLLHSWDAWKYSIVGLALYFGEKLDRALTMLAQSLWPTVRLVSMRELSDDTIALRLHSIPPPAPGTAVKLNIPEVSAFQWHPFTVSDTGVESDAGGLNKGAAGSTWTLHIKASGNKRWTDRLLQLARSQSEGVDTGADAHVQTGCARALHVRALRVRALWTSAESELHSAGQAVQHASAHSIFLVAGGTGITPISSLAGQLLVNPSPASPRAARKRVATPEVPPTPAELSLLDHAAEVFLPRSADDAVVSGQSVCLVWSVRALSLALEFLPLLERLVASPRAKLWIYVTGSRGSSADETDCERLPSWLRPCVFDGRPDLSTLLLSEWQGNWGARVHVCSCGPDAMEQDVSFACESHAQTGASIHLMRMSFNL